MRFYSSFVPSCRLLTQSDLFLFPLRTQSGLLMCLHAGKKAFLQARRLLTMCEQWPTMGEVLGAQRRPMHTQMKVSGLGPLTKFGDSCLLAVKKNEQDKAKAVFAGEDNQKTKNRDNGNFQNSFGCAEWSTTSHKTFVAVEFPLDNTNTFLFSLKANFTQV